MDSNKLVLRASYPNWVAEFPVSGSGPLAQLRHLLAQRKALAHTCRGQTCRLTELEADRLAKEATTLGVPVEWI